MNRGMGDVSTEIPSILLEFFIISSFNDCVITIQISTEGSMAKPEIKNLLDLKDYLLLQILYKIRPYILLKLYNL
jgi:hypothetical protein